MGHAEGTDAHAGYGERVSLRKRAMVGARRSAGEIAAPTRACIMAGAGE